MEVAPISLAITLSLYPNTIYEQLILIAIYRINLPVTVFDFYLFPAPHLVNTIYKNKALEYNYF